MLQKYEDVVAHAGMIRKVVSKARSHWISTRNQSWWAMNWECTPLPW
jgi:hypothetical protein